MAVYAFDAGPDIALIIGNIFSFNILFKPLSVIFADFAGEYGVIVIPFSDQVQMFSGAAAVVSGFRNEHSFKGAVVV